MKFNILLEKTLLESILDIHYPENPEHPTIDDLIIQFYELTHKRSEVIYSKKIKRGNIDTRREKIVAKLDEKLWKVIIELKSRFTPVFKKWLETHALTNPHQWAKMRVKDNYGEDDDDIRGIVTVLEMMVSEFNRYKYPQAYANPYNRGKGLPDFSQIVAKEVMPRLKDFPILQGAFERSFNLEKQQAEQALEQYDEGDTDIDIGVIGYFENYNEAKKAIEQYSLSDFIDMLQDTGAFENSGVLDNIVGSSKIVDMVIEMFEKLVFPLWYGNWSGKGIDKIRANVEQVYNERLLKTSNNLSTEIENIGTIIQTAHVNGNILKDYMEEFGEIDEDGEKESLSYKLLDALTDGTYEKIPEWNADVKEAGF